MEHIILVLVYDLEQNYAAIKQIYSKVLLRIPEESSNMFLSFPKEDYTLYWLFTDYIYINILLYLFIYLFIQVAGERDGERERGERKSQERERERCNKNLHMQNSQFRLRQFHTRCFSAGPPAGQTWNSLMPSVVSSLRVASGSSWTRWNLRSLHTKQTIHWVILDSHFHDARPDETCISLV